MKKLFRIFVASIILHGFSAAEEMQIDYNLYFGDLATKAFFSYRTVVIHKNPQFSEDPENSFILEARNSKIDGFEAAALIMEGDFDGHVSTHLEDLGETRDPEVFVCEDFFKISGTSRKFLLLKLYFGKDTDKAIIAQIKERFSRIRKAYSQ